MKKLCRLGLMAILMVTFTGAAGADANAAQTQGPLLVIGAPGDAVMLFEKAGIDATFNPSMIGVRVSGERQLLTKGAGLEGDWDGLLLEAPLRFEDSMLLLSREADRVYATVKGLAGVEFQSFVYLFYVDDLAAAKATLTGADVPFLALGRLTERHESVLFKGQQSYACAGVIYFDNDGNRADYGTCCTGFLCGLFSSNQTCNNAMNDCWEAGGDAFLSPGLSQVFE